MTTIWMKVTKDKYEFPIVIADTCTELADKSGVSISTVFKNMNRKRKNLNIPREYVKVEVDDD